MKLDRRPQTRKAHQRTPKTRMDGANGYDERIRRVDAYSRATYRNATQRGIWED